MGPRCLVAPFYFFFHFNDVDMDQFFTKNPRLLRDLRDLAKLEKYETVLEPSIGECDIVNNCLEGTFDIIAYEIDEKIGNPEYTFYEDFLTAEVIDTFDLIIGNPPFTFTSEFISKCVDLCDKVLIFLVPSNTFKLTKNIELLQKMLKKGSFTHFYQYSDEHLFEGAAVGICIFRFVVGVFSNRITFRLDDFEEKREYVANPLLNFVVPNSVKIEELFDIFVGYVCGCEKELRTESVENSIEILKAENETERFFDVHDEETALRIGLNKDRLMARKIKKFDSSNWFEYGLKRNERFINENLGKACLYVVCQTRKETICFPGVVQPFGGNLLCCFPKRNDLDLRQVCCALNSDDFKRNFISDMNRFKISHKQLATSFVSFPGKKSEYAVIKEVVDFLRSADLVLEKEQKIDQRVVSYLNEEVIISAIQKHFENVFVPKERHWFDVAVSNVVINIKISSLKSADNACSLAGLAYALTSLKMDLKRAFKASSVVSSLRNIEESDRDYWFIVVNKNDPKDVIFNSIKGLHSITPNLANLPFQIKWSENQNYEKKTASETWELIRKTYKNKQEGNDWKEMFKAMLLD